MSAIVATNQNVCRICFGDTFSFFGQLCTYFDMRWNKCWLAENDIIISRAAKRIFGPQGKRKLGPSSNSPNNDTQTKSTTVYHKQGISTTKTNCDLENSFLLVYLSGISWGPRGTTPADPPSQWAWLQKKCEVLSL